MQHEQLYNFHNTAFVTVALFSSKINELIMCQKCLFSNVKIWLLPVWLLLQTKSACYGVFYFFNATYEMVNKLKHIGCVFEKDVFQIVKT